MKFKPGDLIQYKEDEKVIGLLLSINDVFCEIQWITKFDGYTPTKFYNTIFDYMLIVGEEKNDKKRKDNR